MSEPRSGNTLRRAKGMGGCVGVRECVIERPRVWAADDAPDRLTMRWADARSWRYQPGSCCDKVYSSHTHDAVTFLWRLNQKIGLQWARGYLRGRDSSHSGHRRVRATHPAAPAGRAPRRGGRRAPVSVCDTAAHACTVFSLWQSPPQWRPPRCTPPSTRRASSTSK